MLQIPEGLVRSCRRDPERGVWLARLPELVNDLARRWSLTIGQPFLGEEGSCAFVVRVTRADGTPAVLKVGMPHFEGAQEIVGLRFWDGDATVALLAAVDEANAMVLELCEPGTPLRALPEIEQDVVLAALLRRLWRPPPSDIPLLLRPLDAMLAHWTSHTLAAEDEWPDRALVLDGLSLYRELTATTPQHVVLFTDLHAGNVLRAQRAPWLAIDPKPFVGDPAYDATQHLINCRERMRVAPSATMDRFADLLGVSRERVRRWMFARAAAEPRDDWASSPWLEIARTLRL